MAARSYGVSRVYRSVAAVYAAVHRVEQEEPQQEPAGGEAGDRRRLL